MPGAEQEIPVMYATGLAAAFGGDAISVAWRHGPDGGLASTMVCALPEES